MSVRAILAPLFSTILLFAGCSQNGSDKSAHQKRIVDELHTLAIQGDGAALRQLTTLADAGDAPAEYDLGVMYEEGIGVTKDAERAVAFYRKAADQDYAEAQELLGIKYANGLGVPKDMSQAVNWYRKAAEHGVADAQYDLGIMYEFGDGVPKDLVTAYMWVNLAAARGHNGHYPKARDEIESLMTPSQIADAQKMSREWKPTH
jgi:uncharacterized protein